MTVSAATGQYFEGGVRDLVQPQDSRGAVAAHEAGTRE